ncbi:MAG: cytochrome ubiquinol oxidase subunit I, partial [Acidimicrobiia bacterium]
LFLLAAWYWLSWIFRRDLPRSRIFLGIAAASGVLSIIAMEAGWIVTEVGRQPWIVYELMRVEDAATGNEGVVVTFFAILALYGALAVTTILILRGMKRRFDVRERLEQGFEDHDVPYGPSEPVAASAPSMEERRS